MAKAKTIETVKTIALELSLEEAICLAKVFNAVGGHPFNNARTRESGLSARGVIDGIANALCEVGVHAYQYRDDPRYKTAGSIMFTSPSIGFGPKY